MKRPEDILEILRTIGKTDCVIIGGQAVNLWSERYEKPEPPWSELKPFTSVDLDLLGDRRQVLSVARLLQTDPQFPEPGENTVNAGKLSLPPFLGSLEIDFVHTANGLSTPEILETAPTLRYREIRLRVLHPVLCVESKTVNLATLPQEAGWRQDLKHLRLSLANAREYLAELTRQGADPGALLRWARRLRRDANHQLGLNAARFPGINFQDAIPRELWEQAGGPLADFIRTEWEDWTREIATKLREEAELEKWLQDLQQRQPNQTR